MIYQMEHACNLLHAIEEPQHGTEPDIYFRSVRGYNRTELAHNQMERKYTQPQIRHLAPHHEAEPAPDIYFRSARRYDRTKLAHNQEERECTWRACLNAGSLSIWRGSVRPQAKSIRREAESDQRLRTRRIPSFFD